MDRVLGKVLLLLAGSGLSPKDIRDAVAEMQDLPPSQVADAILHLRRDAGDPLEIADVVLDPGPRSRRTPRPHRPDGDVRRQVEFLLRKEARLTVSQAASELLASVKRERRGAFTAVKPPNKESLYNWLRRALPSIEPSELLHHATLVRNKYVHGAGDADWPLLPR